MKNAKKIQIFLLCIMLFFTFGLRVSAEYQFGNQTYQPLAPIDGTNSGGGTQAVDLSTYLGSIFKIGIGLCGVFAVLMIVIGGLEYVMTEKVASKEDAKTRITNAIVGLLLAISSYVLLYTINPALVSLNFTKLNGSGSGGTVSSGSASAPLTNTIGNNSSGSAGSFLSDRNNYPANTDASHIGDPAFLSPTAQQTYQGLLGQQNQNVLQYPVGVTDTPCAANPNGTFSPSCAFLIDQPGQYPLGTTGTPCNIESDGTLSSGCAFQIDQQVQYPIGVTNTDCTTNADGSPADGCFPPTQ
ncbi:MAG: pilin [Candidatus Pacebacteria bacterium]|nr:pilin [Candidatus Paceibacterota bacterium]